MAAIDPQRLHELRREQKLSRARLADRSKVSERTIQRLEDRTQSAMTPRRVTLERLANALRVEPEVLSGELPSPKPATGAVEEGERVHIGALVAPKARLGYDLAKHRYGVSASEIINMAPLFFALLAEGSLAHRSRKLGEAHEAVGRLDDLCDDADNKMYVHAVITAEDALGVEAESIKRSDVFGDFILDPGYHVSFWGDVFDPSTTNPFASYLRRLAGDLESADSIKVESEGLSYGSPDKFPDYDICVEELERIANGSPDARRALQGGYARITEIPGELMADEEGGGARCLACRATTGGLPEPRRRRCNGTKSPSWKRR